MEANQILHSDLLEIIFDGKNKLYGAYDLRKTYNKRMATALITMLALILLLSLGLIFDKNYDKKNEPISVISKDRTLIKVKIEEPKYLQKLKPAVHVKKVKLNKPVIVEDRKVIIPPPDFHEIAKAEIGVVNIDGPKAIIGIVAPPSEIKGSNVEAKPENKKEKEDSRFMPIEKEASFPGGPKAWQNYIKKAIRNHLDQFTDKDFGTCIVKFIVDKNGVVSNVEATTMKGHYAG